MPSHTPRPCRRARIAPAATTVVAAVAAAGTVLTTVLGGVAQAAPPLPDPLAGAAVTATIDGSQAYQTMAGFGASEAFGEASNVMGMPAPIQRRALTLLFSPTKGAGLTILRNEIGDAPGQTIEPAAPSGGPGGKPTYIPLESINNDIGQLAMAKAIHSQFGVSNFFADAWSPPAYMKDNNSVNNGGTLCGAPGAKACRSGDWRGAYANYLVQYARDWAAEGLPLSYIGYENEANLSPSYESAIMTPAQTADFAKFVGPKLRASGLPTKLECCAAEGSTFAGTYIAAFNADPAADREVSLFTSHSYTTGPIEDPLFKPVPGLTKPLWETENAVFDGTWNVAWDDGSDASGMTWAENIYKTITGAGASAYLYWWGSGSPLYTGNQSLILTPTDPFASGGPISVSSRLWAFANYSRYVHPGAVRIGAVPSDPGVEMTAYRNTNGSTAIVAINNNTSATPVAFSLKNLDAPSGTLATPHVTDAGTAGQGTRVPAVHRVTQEAGIPIVDGGFTATMPARSVVTYVIS